MKTIVFDSSSLISLSSSCLFNAIGEMFKSLGIEAVISKEVEAESVLTPINIKRLELNAMRIKHGIDAGWIKVAGLDEKGHAEMLALIEKANRCFSTSEGNVTILQKGEVEALVLAEKTGAVALAVDERTARMLVEEPERLRRLLEARQECSVKKDQQIALEISGRFAGLKIVRSSEIAALAFEKGFLAKEIGEGEKALEAALYSLKYQGCALSSDEIEDFLERPK
jgi:predicted nucleic acid-binding protein